MKKNKSQRAAAKVAAVTPKEEPKASTPAVEPAKEVKPKKEKTQAEKDLNKVNATGTVKTITDKKDLKYIYPEETNTLELRKKFRAGIRAKIKSFMKQVTTLTNIPEDKRTPDQVKELTKAEKEFAKFARKNLVHKKPVAEPAA